MKAMRWESFTLPWKVRWWWASKPPDPCSGFWNSWKSWGLSAGWVIRRRFGHVQQRPQALRLLTHPGVGPVTALATEVFLGDPSRFANGKNLASYIGMIPCEHISGKRQRLGKLTKEGNSLLRYLWTEATIHAVRKDPELKRFYRRKLIQKGMGKARIAAAHKLGIRLWIMLRDQIDYKEFCRRGQRRQCGEAHAGMPNYNSGPALQ